MYHFLMQRTVIDDRYTLIEPLGGGGMATVYLAHDEVLDREVALKMLREQYAGDEEFVERFRREAQSVARLAHPNIVSIYDRGRSEDGSYYIAMEYVPRGTLKERINRDGVLDPGVAVAVALQIADALSAAHENGVIHRDIKPQNVLMTKTGDVKVTDFGIARAVSSPLTSTSAVLGTAGYMSPEQATSGPVGPASDLYSLGIVLYEMLTGALPHTADNPVAQAMMHVNEPPRSPREANPEVPEPLDAVILKLLAKDPEDRYTSAATLTEDLERVRSGISPAAVDAEKTTQQMAAPLPPLPAAPEERTAKTAARPPAAPTRVPRSGGRRRNKLFPFLAALLFGAVLLAGLLWAYNQGFFEGFGATRTDDSGNQSDAKQPEQPATVLVPDLDWAAEAAGVLGNVGLELGNRSDVTNDVVPAGVVIETNPLEGTGVQEGTAVDITVSTGPEAAPVVQQAPVVQPTPAMQPSPAMQQVPAPAVNENPKGDNKPKSDGKANKDDKKGKDKQKGVVSEKDLGEEEV
jgi:eukaryotic-like serine/threonine-protein kinase